MCEVKTMVIGNRLLFIIMTIISSSKGEVCHFCCISTNQKLVIILFIIIYCVVGVIQRA